jgi:parallel beta-helix repeat protein
MAPEAGSSPIFAYVSHEPIQIVGDSEFAAMAQSEGWSGDGSAEYPFTIQGLEIDGSGIDQSCIFIMSTSVYFTIENCRIVSSHGYESEPGLGEAGGIHLVDVTYGEIAHNEFVGGGYAVVLGVRDGDMTTLGSRSITIRENEMNPGDILLADSSHNTVEGCVGATQIELWDSLDNVIRNNDPTVLVVLLVNSDLNTIAGNTFTDGGVLVLDSSFNMIDDNRFIRGEGVKVEQSLYSSEGNTVSRNVFSQSDVGISVRESVATMIDENEISHSELAVRVIDSTGTTISQNIAYDCSSFGFEISGSIDTWIEQNRVFSCSDWGIYLELSESTTIVDNGLMNNMGGLSLVQNLATEVRDNVFFYHSQSARSLDALGGESFLNNLWSDYYGVDADGDNIGDSPYLGDGFSDPAPIMRRSDYHQAITIDGDADLAAQALEEGWGGSGTSGDPYVISGYWIPGGFDGHAISIRNLVSSSVSIRGCHLLGAIYGLYLEGYSQTTSIVSCMFLFNEYGVWIQTTAWGDSSITDNVFDDNRHAIHQAMTGAYIRNNEFTRNEFGVYLEVAHEVVISMNEFLENENDAIHLYQISGAEIEGNIITSEQGCGILLEDVGAGTIGFNVMDNTVLYSQYGIRVEEVSPGTMPEVGGLAIYNNLFRGEIEDAVDDTVDNWIEHNAYWSYGGTDVDRDLVGDIPHPISGSAGNLDVYPMIGVWEMTPLVDQTIDVEDDFFYHLYAESVWPNGVLHWEVNDTVHFSINQNGFLTNSGPLPRGKYPLTVYVSGGGILSDVFTLTVTGPNRVPVALDDRYEMDEDTILTIPAPGILGNDSDEDLDPLSVVLGILTAHGDLFMNPDGSFEYQPDADWFGTETFTYQAYDGMAYSDVATVTIVVLPVNDLPVAVDDAYVTDEDTVLSVAAPGILTNDYDPDGEPLVGIYLMSSPQHGTLEIQDDGSFTYTPAPNWFGIDSFIYVVHEGGTEAGNEATVTITVQAVEDAPVALPDEYSTADNTEISVPVPGVLANDYDVDSTTLTAVLGTDVASGTLTLNEDGSFMYMPDSGFCGTDYFTYYVTDGFLSSDLVMVTIIVEDVTPPVTTIHLDRPPDTNGWYTADVTVTLYATDTSSGVAETNYSFDGVNWIPYTGPFVVSTEGLSIIRFFSTDLVGNIEDTKTSEQILIDTVNPKSSYSYNAHGHRFLQDWYNEPVEVTLGAVDPSPGSGIAELWYQVDGGDWAVFTDAFVIEDEGAHTIVLYAIDIAGNVEDAHSIELKIDSAAPETQVILDGTPGQNDWYLSDVIGIFSASDDASGVAQILYSFDGVTWITYYILQDGVNLTISSDKQFYEAGEVLTLFGTFKDEAGNPIAGSHLRVRIFAIDQGDITSDYSVLGWNVVTDDDGFWTCHGVPQWETQYNQDHTYSAQFVIEFYGDETYPAASAFSNPVTIACEADIEPPPIIIMGDWGTLSTPPPPTTPMPTPLLLFDRFGPFTITEEGPTTIYYYAIDISGQAEGIKTTVVNIDKTSPETTINTEFVPEGLNVTLTATDAVSGVGTIFYSIDGQATWQEYLSEVQLTADGVVDFYYYSVDVAGNAEDVRMESFLVDTQAPQTLAFPARPPDSNGWYSGNVEITLVAIDEGMGVALTAYRYEGIPWTSYTGPFTISIEGIITLEFNSTDIAGHVESTNAVAIKIDKTNPETAISLEGTLGLDDWYTSDVTFALSATDDLSGVNQILYSFDGTTWYVYYSALYTTTLTTVTPYKVTEHGTINVYGDFTGEMGEPIGGETIDMYYQWANIYHGWSYWIYLGTCTTDDAGHYTYSVGADWPYGEGFDYYIRMRACYAGNSTHGSSRTYDDVIIDVYEEPPPVIIGSIGPLGTLFVGDEGPPAPPTPDEPSGVTISDEGTYTIYYRSIDMAGRAETIRTATVKIDKTPPTTVLETERVPQGVNVTLAATDITSGVSATFYSINGQVTWQEYTGRFTLTSGRVVEVYFYSIDSAGNSEGIMMEPVDVDITPPTTIMSLSESPTDLMPIDGWYFGTVIVTLAATDDLSLVTSTAYSYDQVNWIPYTGPFTVSNEGVTTIYFNSTDSVGNVELTKIGLVRIDTTAPTVIFSFNGTLGAEGQYVTTGTLNVTVVDTGSGLYHVFCIIVDSDSFEESETLDGDGTDNTKTFEFTIPLDGVFVVHVTALDIRFDTLDYWSFGVDLLPPETTASTSELPGDLMPIDDWYFGSVMVTLTATDTVSSVVSTAYSYDLVNWIPYDGPFMVSDEGETTIYFNSTDAQGLVELTKQHVVKIDIHDPVVDVSFDGVLGDGGWYLSYGTLTITVTDTESGLYHVFCIVVDSDSFEDSVTFESDGTEKTRTFQLPIPLDGVFELYVDTRDVRFSTFDHWSFRVDTTFPETTLTTDRPPDWDGWYGANVTVTLTSADTYSGLGTTAYSLDGVIWELYTEPFNVTAEGVSTLYYRSTDIAGNIEMTQTQEFRIDRTAPVTTILPTGTSGNDGWYTSSVQLTLTVDDSAGSGVASTYYRVDSGVATLYTSVIEVLDDGYHTVEFWSEDNLGNMETTHGIYEFKIDTTPPDTVFDWSGYAHGFPVWYESPVDALFRVTEDMSGVALTYYSFDQVAWYEYTGPFQIDIDGIHDIYFYSIDVAGNVEETEIFYSLRIDGTPPECSIELDGTLGENGWYVSDILVTVTLTDPLSGVDNAIVEVHGWAEPVFYYFSGTAEAVITFTVSAESESIWWRVTVGDVTANSDECGGIFLDIDKTPPEADLSYVQVPSIGSVVTLTASDATSGVASIMYSVDGANWEAYDAPFTLSEGGVAEVRYYAIDVAGNIGDTSSAAVEVDVLPPVTTYELEGILGLEGWYVSNVNVTLLAADDVSGVASIAYSYDGMTWNGYGDKLEISSEGHTRVYFRATDIIGNVESTQFIDIYIDKTSPTTALIIGAPSYEDEHVFVNSSTPLTLTVSDGISGLGYMYYCIDGGEWNEYVPFYLLGADGLHTIDFYSVDVAGNTEAAQSVSLYLDNSAPETSLSLSGELGTNDWFVSSVSLNLVSSDGAGSGTAVIFYVLDDGDTESFAGVVEISVNGIHAIQYWSLDNLGNTESPVSIEIRIDTAAPTSAAVLNPSVPDGLEGWYVSPVLVALNAEDADSGVLQIYYTINGGEAEGYGEPILFDVDGTYTVQFWSVDLAGNTGPTGGFYIQIDQTPPVTTLTVHPPYSGSDPTVVTPTTEFSLAATDSLSGLRSVEYRIDDGEWVAYGAPFTVEEFGPHTVFYRSIDRAGNEESEQALTILVAEPERYRLAYTGDLVGTYSDPAYLEAILTEASGQLSVAGKTVFFTIGDQTVSVLTDSEGIASVSLILDQPGGVYTVTAWAEEDGEQLASAEPVDFTIEREYAYVEYTGSTVVPIGADTITLRATAYDDEDGYWGDLGSAFITFSIYDDLAEDLILMVEYGPYAVLTTGTEGVGVFTIDVPNLPEEGYIVQVTLDWEDNEYYQGPASSLVNLVVYEPSGEFVTGGGWIWDSNGNRGSFVFLVRYNWRGSLWGFVLYTFRIGDSIYLLRSTEITGFTVEENHAFFEATCAICYCDLSSLNFGHVSGEYRLRIDVWDNIIQDGSREDVFQIRIYDGIGQVWYQAGFDPYGILQGGCIVLYAGRD